MSIVFFYFSFHSVWFYSSRISRLSVSADVSFNDMVFNDYWPVLQSKFYNFRLFCVRIISIRFYLLYHKTRLNCLGYLSAAPEYRDCILWQMARFYNGNWNDMRITYFCQALVYLSLIITGISSCLRCFGRFRFDYRI